MGPGSAPGTLIVGIGNALRGDDAAGLAVARRLEEALSGRHDPQVLSGAAVLRHDGEGASLMEVWQGREAVILVDAVLSGAAPGAIHRLDALSQPLPAGWLRCSTHAFGVAEAVELARAMGRLPPRLVLYGIEANSFAPGAGLSPEVGAAVPVVAELVLQEARAKIPYPSDGRAARGPLCWPW